MCHSRALNNKINGLHDRCLRLLYNDKQLTFEELLEKDDSVSIHIRNLQTLATEMYKVMKGDSTETMKEIFRIREENGYNLRPQNIFKRPKIWELISTGIKELVSLNGFKKVIEKWKPVNSPCRLGKTYIHHVGFIS